MRVIKFRGQARRKGEYLVNMAGDKCDSNWVYGGIFPQNEDEKGFAVIYQQEPEIEKYSVYADTVGQYTGLKDENGREIYEGDIVRCVDTVNEIGMTAIVEFGNPNGEYNWGFQLRRIQGDNANTDILLWVETEIESVHTRVIGNIFDNPELLGGDTD